MVRRGNKGIQAYFAPMKSSNQTVHDNLLFYLSDPMSLVLRTRDQSGQGGEGPTEGRGWGWLFSTRRGDL